MGIGWDQNDLPAVSFRECHRRYQSPARQSIAVGTASSAVTAATVTPAAAAASGFARTRFVDGQGAALPILAVERRCGRGSGFRGFHGDKGEAAGFAGHPILHEVDLGDWAVLGEKILQIVFDRVEGQVSDE